MFPEGYFVKPAEELLLGKCSLVLNERRSLFHYFSIAINRCCISVVFFICYSNVNYIQIELYMLIIAFETYRMK